VRSRSRGRSVTTYYLTTERPSRPPTHARRCQCDLCWPTALEVRARSAQHALPWFARKAERAGVEPINLPPPPAPVVKRTKAEKQAERAAARARAERAAYAETDRVVRELAQPVVPATAEQLEELRRANAELWKGKGR
jgi:hypothetical protein